MAFTLPITSSFNPGFFVHYDGKHSWYVCLDIFPRIVLLWGLCFFCCCNPCFFPQFLVFKNMINTVIVIWHTKSWSVFFPPSSTYEKTPQNIFSFQKISVENITYFCLSWRTCDDWKCLGRCDMYLALESEFQDYTTTDDIDLVNNVFFSGLLFWIMHPTT